MYKFLNSFILFICSMLILTSCNLTGVNEDDNDENIEELNDSLSDNIEEIDEGSDLMLKDSVNGEPNKLVFQREDGLRVEWSIKKNENQIQINDVVMVNYTARVAAGEVYDSNEEIGFPVPLKTNVGMMVPGWEQGLLEMHIGDVGRIMIPSALGYGENGYLTIVPPDADLIIDIEIIERIAPIKLKEGVKVYKWKTVKDGSKPVKNQIITFDYFAYTVGKGAKMYDNSYQNEQAFSFKYMNANVIDGLHQGMSVMKAGESAFIEIPYVLAYGKKGLLDHVDKNTDIVYDVRISSIE